MLILTSFSLYADGVSISYGKSSSIDESTVQKISYVVNFEDINTSIKNSYKIEADLSYFIWENLYGDDITGASLTPMFRYFIPLESLIIFAGAGIGVAYVDQVRWGNRELGDNWMFEDKLELGILFSPHNRISINLTHYSNAGLNSNNDGTNIFSLNYSYHW